MAGKEIKAVKRNSFLNTASCRALSSATRGKDGLCNAVYHARNRGMSHAVPLVCLRKVTHFPFRVELTPTRRKNKLLLIMVKIFVMIILLLNPIISLIGVKSNRKQGLQREK